jgi:hypothetical protein
MDARMDAKKEIKRIHERNRRVELDKEWETSWARRGIVAILTYLVIVIFFYSARLPDPWANALVPTLAFLISTMSVPLFKRMWLRSRNP